MPHKPVCLVLGLGLLATTGCLSPVRQETDALICHRANVPVDLLPPRLTVPAPDAIKPTAADADEEHVIEQAGGKQPTLPKTTLEERLLKPLVPEIPGTQAPPIKLPKGPDNLKALEAAVAKFFPPQAPLGPDPRPVPGPAGRPLSLADLQKLARSSSPVLRQAASDIKSFEGAAVQAGLYPNPTVGPSTSTLGPSGGPLFGVVFSQMIKTMGKLKLAEAAATMDLANAQIAYRRAETDLMGQVRAGYFAVLASQEAIRANRALADLTDEVYKVMVAQLKAGEVATYEPLQIGVLAAQSRAALIQSRNSYLLAWKQLASALGLPAMPATELDGRLDQSLPRFDYEKALAHVLANHTDVLTAQYTIEKARYTLRLAEVTPVPDVTLQATVQYDATPPGPPRLITLLQGSVPVPIFDHNQGGIKQAQGQLLRAVEEPHRVRADLTARVSDAFRRMEENRVLLELYRTQILPQQVQAFRAAVKRHYGGEPEKVAYTDLITAQQGIVGVVATYLTTLGNYWQAVSDVSSLLQTDNVYQLAVEVETCPLPDLGALLNLPCCHPCSPLPDPALKGVSSFEAPPGQPVAPAMTPVPGGEGAVAPAPPSQQAAPPTVMPAYLPPAGAVPTGGTVDPAPR
jgi:cobalt-zinc-cadmium efflux system outer membrane protein